ncbi:hypothetical protein N0V90_010878 [Kalmusia sp. IMI 367209]|nr:hypothetical protein N0V90_010878 [Kalmusia sp. IMI 367209]
MTGRGDGKLIRPSSNPDIEIGISLTTSPVALDPSSTSPFYIVITARILKSPHPDRPITLQAYLNPFESLPNRSISNIQCTSSPESSIPTKYIEIWPRGWPNYNTGEKDWRKKWKHITIRPDKAHTEYHEVLRQKIAACAPEVGERYKVELTDKALGTRFWCWGDLADMEGWRFGRGL